MSFRKLPVCSARGNADERGFLPGWFKQPDRTLSTKAHRTAIKVAGAARRLSANTRSLARNGA